MIISFNHFLWARSPVLEDEKDGPGPQGAQQAGRVKNGNMYNNRETQESTFWAQWRVVNSIWERGGKAS